VSVDEFTKRWCSYLPPCPSRTVGWAPRKCLLGGFRTSGTRNQEGFCPTESDSVSVNPWSTVRWSTQSQGNAILTVGPGVEVSTFPSASQPTIKAMSCISVLTSLAGVLCDRSWLSFARRHGCWETWTVDGSGADILTDYRVVRGMVVLRGRES
jgi:hypothetical protein